MGSLASLITLASHRPGRDATHVALGRWCLQDPSPGAVRVWIAGAPWFGFGPEGPGLDASRVGDVVVEVSGAPPGAAEVIAAIVAQAGDARVTDERRGWHDLRGALGVVLGQTDMLAEGLRGPLPERAAASVAAIQRQVTRAVAVVDALDPRLTAPEDPG